METFSTTVITTGLLTLNGLVIPAFVIILAIFTIRSKTFVKVVEDNGMIFGIIAMFTFGFIGWLVSWAVYEMLVGYNKEYQDEYTEKKRKKTQKKADKKTQKELEEYEAVLAKRHKEMDDFLAEKEAELGKQQETKTYI